MVLVAVRNAGDTEVLIVLAATLPRQIEMTKDVYTLASGWNDMVAVWARLGGVVDNMQPDADAELRRAHQVRPADPARGRETPRRVTRSRRR